MAARSHRPAGRRVLLVRAGGLLTAVLAAAGLVVLPPAGGSQAHADTGSSVTRSGAKGQYDDFSQLRVTVEQTENLRTQGVKVTWTGGAPTQKGSAGDFGTDFLQIMQCWGSAADGPTRDKCEFGNVAGIGTTTASRTVDSAAEPAVGDPLEPVSRFVPFTAANGGTATDANDLNTYFSRFTTNEQPATTTGADGSGETIFSLEDSTTSPILGCGAVAQEGEAPEPCWLVVVPRGSHEANGAAAPNGVNSSPLSASNWANRIAFRLDFDPTESACKLGQDEQQVIGSEMGSGAMESWEPALCTGNSLNVTYIPQPEDYSRGQIANPGTGSAGLALVENPVLPETASAPVVHAPVALSGLVIGYNIQLKGSSRQVPRIRLNARLVAKMLTQSYKCDLPGKNTDLTRGDLPVANPNQLSDDPEFLALNTDAGFTRSNSCTFGFSVPADASDTNTQLWRWLRSDPDARSFLSGTPDHWGMTINPHYLALKPATTALTLFDKPDPTQYIPDPAFPDLKSTPIALNPYGNSLADDAKKVRNANNGGTLASVNNLSIPPAMNKALPQIPGQNFMLGLTDAASAARYRLGTAELLNSDGQFVAPTADSMAKAAAGMKSGPVPGVLDADPALKTPGAYPLTSVTYAAAATSLSLAQRTSYATLIRYAAGPGQQSGIGYGLLPPGYVPLTPALHDQALTAAAALVAGKPVTDGPGSASGGGSAGSSSGGSDGGTTGTGGLGGSAAGGAAGGTAAGGSPTPSTAAPAAATTKGAAGGPSTSPPVSNVAQTGGTTPGAILGAVRWVLLIVLIAGIAGSLAGPLLMRAGTVHGTDRPFFAFLRGKSAA